MLPSFPVLSNPSFQVSWKEGKGGEDKLRCVHAKSFQLFCATLWLMGYTLFTVRSHIPFHKSRSMEIYSVWRSGHKISLLVDTMYSFSDDLEVVRVCTKKKVVKLTKTLDIETLSPFLQHGFENSAHQAATS